MIGNVHIQTCSLIYVDPAWNASASHSRVWITSVSNCMVYADEMPVDLNIVSHEIHKASNIDTKLIYAFSPLSLKPDSNYWVVRKARCSKNCLSLFQTLSFTRVHAVTNLAAGPTTWWYTRLRKFAWTQALRQGQRYLIVAWHTAFLSELWFWRQQQGDRCRRWRRRTEASEWVLDHQRLDSLNYRMPFW